MQFIIDNTFWSLFPDTLIGVVVVHGIDNRAGERADIEGLVEAAKDFALEDHVTRNI